MLERNPQRVAQPPARLSTDGRKPSTAVLSLVVVLVSGLFLCPVSAGLAEPLSYVAQGVVIAKAPGEIQVEIPGKDEVDGVVYRVPAQVPILDEQGLAAGPDDVPLRAHVALHIEDDTVVQIVLLED